MSFEAIPKLKWRWCYPIFQARIAPIAVVMLVLFRPRGWLGGEKGGSHERA